jgi:PKHD-type hydroxylase
MSYLTVIEDILTTEQIQQILEQLEDIDMVSGTATAGAALHSRKHNLQTPLNDLKMKPLMQNIIQALGGNERFFRAVYPKRFFPPIFSRYEVDMHYGEHVDNALMRVPQPMRTDVAMTLFLSEPDSYDGGELVVKLPGGEEQVKLAAGAVVIYPPHFVHRVEPVTRGVRLAVITWVESLVRDAEKRQVLSNLDNVVAQLINREGLTNESNLISSSFHNLMRMRCEP